MTKTATIGDNKPPPLDVILRDKHKDIFDRAKKWVVKAKRADLSPKTIEDCAKLEALFKEGRDIANDADGIRATEKEPSLQEGRIIDGLFNGEIINSIGSDSKKGGLAMSINRAAATRRLEITRAEQAAAADQEAALRKKADELAEKAASQEAKGQVKQADVTTAQVAGLDAKADQLGAFAAAPVADASRGRTATGGSVSVSAKLKCTGVVRDEIDLEKLRPYFDQDAIVKAVNAGLKMKAFSALKGAAIVEDVLGRVR
jgi:hypothetical protein